MDRKQRILNYKDEMVDTLAKLVKFNSVQGEETKDAPFGEVPKACLLEALKIIEGHGFKTYNLDNYIGYGEVGEGEEIVGVLGHLDIVPAGDGWTSDPFTLTLRDGKLYGRGTSDDKGAMIASLYAIKVLMDEGYKFNKRVRLIFGTNEENGSKCLEHYVEKEGHFTYGFTPDGEFPGIFGEKGMLSGKFHSTNTNIISMTGGLATNVVCNKCTTVVKNDFCDFDKLKEYFNNNNLKYEITNDNDKATLVVYGVSAHASTPHLGVNAISHTFKAFEYAGSEDEFVKQYNSCIGLYTDGTLAGIKYSEEYGDLTFNNGVISTENGVITGTIDVRTGLICDSQALADKMIETLTSKGLAVTDVSSTKSLFIDAESPMVKSLVKAYADVTGDTTAKPMSIGGGTYAKGINNCIAFGCQFLDDDNHIHDVDEFVKLDDLLLQVEIYCSAIQNLCEL